MGESHRGVLLLYHEIRSGTVHKGQLNCEVCVIMLWCFADITVFDVCV